MTPELESLLRSWERHLRAGNRSKRTVEAYLETLRWFGEWLGDRPPDRLLLRDYIAEMVETRAAATAETRWRRIRQFDRWLTDEEEVYAGFTAGVARPLVPEQPVDTPSDETVAALIKACVGKTFVDRRDEALIRCFIDTGARRGEMEALQVPDVDLDQGLVRVLGKGRRHRLLPLSSKTVKSMDRYERLRGGHPQRDVLYYWLGTKGQLTGSGIYQLFERRCAQAGIPRLYPHQLRHLAADSWLSQGGHEESLMSLMGWRSRQMLGRYGASNADARARAEHRKMAPGDRF